MKPDFVCLVSDAQVRKLDEDAAIEMEKRRAELGTTCTELSPRHVLSRVFQSWPFFAPSRRLSTLVRRHTVARTFKGSSSSLQFKDRRVAASHLPSRSTPVAPVAPALSPATSAGLDCKPAPLSGGGQSGLHYGLRITDYGLRITDYGLRIGLV